MSFAPNPQRRGTLQLEPDGSATLTFERHLRHTAEHVWQALTTPEGLREWLQCTSAHIAGYVGGPIELVSGAAGYHSTGKILEWDPPRVFAYEWRVAPVPEMPLGENAIFRFELTALADAQTLLAVRYTRLTAPTARGFLPGLHAFLDRLEAQLAAEPLPDWHQRFVALLGEYPAWHH